MRKTSGSRCISSRSAWFNASRYVRTGMGGSVGVNVGVELGRVGLGRLVGKADRILDLGAYLLVERADRRFIENAVFQEPLGPEGDRVALPLALDLFPGAVVAVNRIGHRVAHEPVGADLEQRRKLLLPRA